MEGRGSCCDPDEFHSFVLTADIASGGGGRRRRHRRVMSLFGWLSSLRQIFAALSASIVPGAAPPLHTRLQPPGSESDAPCNAVRPPCLLPVQKRFHRATAPPASPHATGHALLPPPARAAATAEACAAAPSTFSRHRCFASALPAFLQPSHSMIPIISVDRPRVRSAGADWRRRHPRPWSWPGRVVIKKAIFQKCLTRLTSSVSENTEAFSQSTGPGDYFTKTVQSCDVRHNFAACQPSGRHNFAAF
jgi:hypothetical protein